MLLRAHARAVLEQHRATNRLAITQAWVTANLSRVPARKRLPSLASLLRGERRPLTDEDKAWAAQIRQREGHRPITTPTPEGP